MTVVLSEHYLEGIPTEPLKEKLMSIIQHIKYSMQPSMKSNVYQTYILLGHHGDPATILSTTRKCVAGYVYAVHITYHVCVN